MHTLVSQAHSEDDLPCTIYDMHALVSQAHSEDDIHSEREQLEGLLAARQVHI